MQDGELEIFRPEIMAPLGHAMGFINGKQADLSMFQQIEETGAGKPFGCYIDQIQLAARHLAFNVGGFAPIQ